MKKKRITNKNNSPKAKQESSVSEGTSSESSLNADNKKNYSTNKQKQRNENSLGELTKNFIKYIKDKGDNIVHINDVVKKLKVKKRRIYDITNVLEGTLLK
jgi:hypothetical protein